MNLSMQSKTIMLAGCLLGATQMAQASATSATMTAPLRVQILLARVHFSSGEIDGVMGGNLRQALRGYQAAHALPVTGKADLATMAALGDDSAPPLVSYTISEQDAAGPFEKIPKDMAKQATRSALGYASLEEALAERFHSSPALLKRLNRGKRFAAGLAIEVPNLTALPALPKAARVLVDQSERILALLDADGKVLAQFPATSGSKRDPLPVGEWKVNSISNNPTFHFNPKLFWDAKEGDVKATLAPGPNNPVGVVWIDLSKEHYGIHGTPEPANIGKTQSHGCIRLTNWDAHLAAQALAAGVPVTLQD